MACFQGADNTGAHHYVMEIRHLALTVGEEEAHSVVTTTWWVVTDQGVSPLLVGGALLTAWVGVMRTSRGLTLHPTCMPPSAAITSDPSHRTPTAFHADFRGQGMPLLRYS